MAARLPVSVPCVARETVAAQVMPAEPGGTVFYGVHRGGARRRRPEAANPARGHARA